MSRSTRSCRDRRVHVPGRPGFVSPRYHQLVKRWLRGYAAFLVGKHPSALVPVRSVILFQPTAFNHGDDGRDDSFYDFEHF